MRHLWIGAGTLVAGLLAGSGVDAAPVPVRFPEGSTHGFLVLRSLKGDVLAQGALLQVPRRDRVESRLIFRFKDGSQHDERAVFSQRQVFTLLSYRLVQSGPAFAEQLEVSMDRETGDYTVRSRSGQGRAEEVHTGRLELPPDVYNGMVTLVLKNLPRGVTETVHVVAFTPKPRVIKLELAPVDTQTVLLGHLATPATHYRLRPQLGGWLRLAASLMGKRPPDSHCWILNDDVPAFVRFEGPLSLTGPPWRIELTSPRWPPDQPAQ